MTEPALSPDGRGPVAWMAGNSVAANLVMLLCLVGGLIALRHVRQEVFPDIQIDAVMVSVPYPGASPEEVEAGIVLAVEEAVQGLENVEEVDSTAAEGSGSVIIELVEGGDLQKLADDVQSEVDRITTFPDDAEEPTVSIISHSREVLSLVIYGDVDSSALHEVGEYVRDQLLPDPGITQLELVGLPDLEIAIEVPQENLRRYGLTLQDVADRIRRASVEIPGGGLKTSAGEVLVRMKERRDYGREFAELPIITTADGSQVRLGQIAAIRDGFEDTDRYTLYNGKPAVMVNVFRVGDQTPIEVSGAVRRQMEDISQAMPPGVAVAIEDDRADHYRERVELLVGNGMLGLVLVLLLLGLFLEARLAFWVMLGIPVSFLGSFLLLPALGVSLNMMSLFAYIIALGIVVDDAIVVGENVYHYRQQGVPALRAAVKATREVAMPVTFSVLTNIVTFMPLYVIPGVMGRVFRQIPIVVSIVFLISLVECLFVLPAHLGHQKDRRRRGASGWLHGRQQAFSAAFKNLVNHRYGPFLLEVMRHRYVTTMVAVSVLLLVLSYALSGRMGMGLFPKSESDFAQAEIVFPYGSPVEKTEEALERLLAGARAVIRESGYDELLKSVIAEVGDGGSHVGRIRAMLAGPDVRKRTMSTEEFTGRWREAVGEILGTEYVKFESDVGGPGRGSAVTVELSHRDIAVLEAAGGELAAELQTYPRVSDVDDGFRPGKEQMDYVVRPEGRSLGLTAYEVARQMRNAYYGAEAARQQRGRNEVKVMVRLPEEERVSEHGLESLLVRTPAGTDVPLREVALAKRGRAYTTIERRNGRRVVQVSGDVSPRSQATEVLGDLQREALPRLAERYPGLIYSFEGHQAEMRKSLGSLKMTFLLALLCIYAMLAIPFRSYSQPLIVMTSIPFGIVGAVIGHLIMGYDLSVISMFGIVALSGVVVNDSLVMIDYSNRRRREHGDCPWDAIHSAALQRFRPIMLTSLTTFGGLAPMILETSFQARMMVPMAISLGFGILFATLITLVLVPSLYLITEDLKALAGRARRSASPSYADAQGRNPPGQGAPRSLETPQAEAD